LAPLRSAAVWTGAGAGVGRGATAGRRPRGAGRARGLRHGAVTSICLSGSAFRWPGAAVWAFADPARVSDRAATKPNGEIVAHNLRLSARPQTRSNDPETKNIAYLAVNVDPSPRNATRLRIPGGTQPTGHR